MLICGGTIIVCDSPSAAYGQILQDDTASNKKK